MPLPGTPEGSAPGSNLCEMFFACVVWQERRGVGWARSSPIVSASSECWENLSAGSCVIFPCLCTGKVRAAQGCLLPLSSLSLFLCFPFILLPRSRMKQKEGAGSESATGYQQSGDKRNCFLSATAAALVNFFSSFHTTVVPHYPVPGSIFFFFPFWGFEVSVIPWLLQKKRR